MPPPRRSASTSVERPIIAASGRMASTEAQKMAVWFSGIVISSPTAIGTKASSRNRP